MDAEFLRTLLRRSESDTLDYKRDQYRFAGADDENRSELLKDILAFANAWKESDAYIVIGVEEENGRAGAVVGATTDLKDHEVQQVVKSKTNRPVSFAFDVIHMDGAQITVITIAAKQARPLFLKKSFGRLKANTVYVRRGSSTDEASPDEIAEMGSSQAKAAMQLKKPKMTLEFEHVCEIYRDQLALPMFRREPYEIDWLQVYARNVGAAVAHIVEATIQIPKALLWDHAPCPLAIPKSMEGAELAELRFTNWFCEPVSIHVMHGPPPSRHEVLPGKRVGLGSDRIFPRDLLLHVGCEVLWTVQCDDEVATEGVISYKEIPFVDRKD